jgi:autoinducer 2 (AI-2) kinase
MSQNEKLLLALDAGTGSFRAILFDSRGHELEVSQVEWTHPTDSRYPGSINFDYERNWKLISSCIKDLFTSGKYHPEDVAGVAADSFREGFVLYDEDYNELIAFSNIDSRAEAEAVYLKNEYPNLEMDIYKKTGQTFALNAVPRLLWVKNHEPEIYEKVRYINMLNDWISFKLTGRIISEPSNSSTSGLFDLKKKRWLPEIPEACGLKSNIFPEVLESGDYIANVSPKAAAETGLSPLTKVICGGGDAQLGCIGVGSIHENQAALFGGSFWQYEYNTNSVETDEKGRLRVNCHAIPNEWQYEAIAWNAGLVMRWFRDAFLEFEVEQARQTGKSVYALMDLGAGGIPSGSNGMVGVFADTMNFHNMKHAAPTFTNFGIDPKKYNKYTFFRSIMENAGLITLGHLKMIKELTGNLPEQIIFAGGSSYSDLWSQITCDILGIELVTPKEKEATALGAAILAGVGIGLFYTLEEAVDEFVKMDKVYQPDQKNHAIYEALFERWEKIYHAQLQLSDEKITNYMWIAAGAE